RNCVQSSARHIKLQNALLMLNRMLLIFCFCLAISRPVLQPRVAPTDPQQHPEAGGKTPMGTAHVFILDASASMSLHQHEETLFAAAQKAILKIIDQMPAQDTCNVVLAGRRAHSLFGQNEKNNAVIRKQIMNIRAGFETANIPQAIIRALQLLQDSRLPRRRIYIIGDTQVTNWRLEDRRLWRKIGAMLEKTRIPPALYFLPLPLPAKAEKNIQIVSITSPEPLQDTFRESHFLIKIINYGNDPQVSRLDFFVDGKLKTERRVTLKPGENVFLFRNLFSSAGVHLLHAQVEDTAFIPDNEFVYACRITDVLPVLVSVDDPEDNTVTRASSIFVREALSTGISPHAQLFRVSTISHARLDTMDPAELRRYRAILILDPPSFSHHLRLRLRNYVRVGGGVMILAGPRLNATIFRNQELSEQEPFLP
ncbi:MAG: VWA domain-containing protein, partial [Lentisphaerae bacterium]